MATAGCLRGAGGRVKPGTRAWDGLLEALRANLIAALFLNGMFSYAVWLAQPLQDVHRSTPVANPFNGSCLHASVRNGASGWWSWLVVVVGAACVSAGSEHGVVRGADNGIQAEGAVALAAALQGNTTLQTLDLRGMWTARTRAFCGNEGAARGPPRECAGGEAGAAGVA